MRRRWKILVGVFAGVFTVTTLLTLFTVPVYEAQMLLQVTEGSRTPAIFGELAVLSASASVAETEMEVLKSRSLLSEVVHALKLDNSIAFQRSDVYSRMMHRFGLANGNGSKLPSVVNLNVTSELLGEELVLEFAGNGTDYVLIHEKEQLLKGSLNQSASSPKVDLEVQSDGALSGGAKFTVIKRDIRKATGSVSDNLRVVQVGRNTGVVRVSYQSTNPKKAATVLNTLSRLYINRDVQERSREAIATLNFITDQLDQVRVDLEKAQSLLDEYKVRTGSVALSQEAQLLVQRVSDMEVEINRLGVQRKGLESLLASMESDTAAIASGAVALGIQSPELAVLVSDYSELMRKKTQLLLEFMPENPAVVDLDRQIELVTGQVRATAGAILNGTKRREEAVKGVLGNYRKQLASLPEVERSLAKYQKDVLIQEKIYSFLLEKEQETRIVKASSISGIRIVDPPTVPIEPIKPKKRRNITLGIMLGMMLGVGMTFFIEYLDNTIKGDDELESIIGIPVYGRIQFIKEAKDRRKKRQPHLVIEQPRSPISEAFRILRTNILLSRIGESPRVITVSSPGPGEGKSFVVANLAAISSYAAKSTIIIDADMRKPQQHIVFGANVKPGLAEVLTGKADLKDAIQLTQQGLPNLLTAGNLPPNPSELLGSTYMGNLLGRLKEDYEFIILDSPPLGMVTDPALLMKHTDLGLIIVRADMTRKGSTSHAVNMLRKTSPDLQLGVVINAVKFMGEYSYQNGYGGY
jgi:tyrosine-protein kinase Etk/Wzc